jgi:transcriptional regulator with XRE-family HTH domain
MSLFSDNIRVLRVRQKISQEKLAESLQITRGRYVKYEDGTSEAPYEILKKIARYYHMSIDLLLSVDIRKIDMQHLLKLEKQAISMAMQIQNILKIYSKFRCLFWGRASIEGFRLKEIQCRRTKTVVLS